MLPKTICSRTEYECALREMEAYFETEPLAGTPEAERFDTLLRMVEDFEAAHYAVECPGCGEVRLELQADSAPAATDPARIPEQILAEFCQSCAMQLNEHSRLNGKGQVSRWATSGTSDGRNSGNE